MDEGSRAQRRHALLRGAVTAPWAASLHTICESGTLPEPAGVLVPADGHVHDPRQRLHPAVRVLPVPKGEPLHVEQTNPPGSPRPRPGSGRSYVVITSVTRDDLPDGGAGHFAACVRAVKERLPAAAVEVLTPDFLGDPAEALETWSPPARGLQPQHRDRPAAVPPDARPKASYDGSRLLERAKETAAPDADQVRDDHRSRQTNEEVVDTMGDLRRSVATWSRSGSTSSPRATHAPIDRWVHRDEFRWLRKQGEALGFGSVFTDPLVRLKAATAPG